MERASIEKKYLNKTSEVVRLVGESQEVNDRYNGRIGKVLYIDDIGQLHGDWGGLAVIPNVDEFKVLN